MKYSIFMKYKYGPVKVAIKCGNLVKTLQIQAKNDLRNIPIITYLVQLGNVYNDFEVLAKFLSFDF